MTGAPEPDLDDVRALFPCWEVWTGVSGLVYARLRGSSPPLTARGEDPRDLIDQIRGVIGRRSL
jgi:hypothetical protein